MVRVLERVLRTQTIRDLIIKTIGAERIYWHHRPGKATMHKIIGGEVLTLEHVVAAQKLLMGVA